MDGPLLPTAVQLRLLIFADGTILPQHPSASKIFPLHLTRRPTSEMLLVQEALPSVRKNSMWHPSKIGTSRSEAMQFPDSAAPLPLCTGRSNAPGPTCR